MTTLDRDHRHSASSVSGAQIIEPIRAVYELLSTWSTRAANRRELRGLLVHEQRIFKDIGLRRDDVMREAFKPFWRA